MLDLSQIRPTVEDSVFALIKLLDEKANQEAFDILNYYKEFAIDVIYRIALGQQGSKMFQDDKMTRVDKIFQRSFRQPIFYLANTVPCLGPMLRKLLLATSKLRQKILPVPVLFEQVYRTIDDRIDERVIYDDWITQ
ncbi:unnamed protein product [Strongylus vulgaris]|uniref:Uncharacterized protein n=1 Tax=Strongylus vulgaris TaxID=40348 RepID=A0A3P7I7C4_STRVU|nr:unnamed protein product [Strongylus vulgaris]